MTTRLCKQLSVLIGSLLAFNAAWAQSQAASQDSDDVTRERVQFFAGEKLWIANWQAPIFDARIVVPSASNPTPVLQTSMANAVSSTSVIPMTSFGLRYGAFTLSATLMSSTGFSSDGVTANNQMSRKESDVNISYALLPNLQASLIYKSGTISGLGTAQAVTLTGKSGDADLTGVILGLSGSAPLAGAASLYGSLAYGTASENIPSSGLSLGSNKFTGTYHVAEFGVAYRLADESMMSGLKNLSLQVGYRVQVVTLNNIPQNTYSTGAVPSLISTSNLDSQSTTQGFVVGVAAAF